MVLPENQSLTVEGTSDETVPVSPVITINMFSTDGNKLSYEADEPIEIDFPVNVSCIHYIDTHIFTHVMYSIHVNGKILTICTDAIIQLP